MSLSDHLQAQTAPIIPAKRTAPTGWEPGVRYDVNTGLPSDVTTEQLEQDVAGKPAEWADLVAHLLPMIPPGHELRLVEARYDPVAWTRATETREINDVERKRPATTRPAWRYRFRVVPVAAAAAAAALDVAELVKIARGNRRRTNPTLGHGRTRVVVISDPQIGKVDHRGGTPELLERIERMLAQVDDLGKWERCDDAVILDPGDLTEGFENTAQQQHTNDLSFPDQLNLANGLLTEIVTSIAGRYAATRVATVPSNHGAWRKGKDRLGRPGDDFGIMTHRTVARALAARDDIAWLIPDPWQESLALRVRAAVLGLVHGHQVNRPDQFPQFWAAQTHGGGPLAAATIAVSGHFHHLRTQPTGAIDGRARWWFQAPTLDNGSSWWSNTSGDECEPGLLTFTIDDTGRWDHLRLLTA